MTPVPAAPDEHPSDADARRAALARLAERFDRHERWFVLTGAGISTASGIPDYRDAQGGWKRRPPVTVQAFTGDALARARYWARSMIGWPRIEGARPNAAHEALARLAAARRFTALVTQNVDGLHQRAGTEGVIDLHGRLDGVVCLGCGGRSARREMQQRLLEDNPGWAATAARFASLPTHSDGAPTAPDGDVDLESEDFGSFRVPDCLGCGGMLKPDVVFFGETVPRARVEAALDALGRADAMLVAGSSLMVYSGFRFAREAAQRGLPVVAVNIGRTRADDLLADKIELPCDTALAMIADRASAAAATAPASG